MSAFSFTAPLISEEEEKVEQQNLTPEEREELECDLCGKEVAAAADPSENASNDDYPTPQVIRQVHDLIQLLPEDSKLEYLQALKRVPALVETESDPVKFLHCCKHDVHAAAKRLVSYWKIRKDVFGEDRAFLPMTLAGAMAKDRAALEKGLIQILPDDIHGRPVFFFDRIRSVKSVLSREEVTRIHFYLFHAMAERDSVVQKGYVRLVFLKGLCFVEYGFDLYMHFDRILAKKIFAVMNVVPVRCLTIHNFTGSGQSVMGLVLPVIKHMLGKRLRLRLLVHAGSDKEILERLAMYGVTGDHLEGYVSGSYVRQHATFLAWVEQRMQEETKDIASTRQSVADT